MLLFRPLISIAKFSPMLGVFFSVMLSIMLSSPSWAQETDAIPIAAVTPAITGTGAQSYIPLWTSSTALGKSKLFQTGGNVGIGTITPKWALDVNGYINAAKGYRINEYGILGLAGPATDYNIAVGYGAFPNNYSGTLNTAVGAYSLNALGGGAFETAVGAFALTSANGSDNDTAIGAYAMYANQDGEGNTAVGNFALRHDAHGSDNIAVGYTAGINVTLDNNIDIGNAGTGSDAGAVRIGTAGNQTSVFVAGVSGVPTGLAEAVPVVIDANGQLGTISSSRRFKEDIQDMGDASRGLMQLRPVTFRYQKPFADGAKPLQYGLIAEEVAEVYPGLVAHSADGQIETVKYQVLDSMLLNEVQRQQVQIRALEDRLAKMEAALAQSSKPGEK